MTLKIYFVINFMSETPINTKINGVYELKLNLFEDDRGS